ncbi:MAG: hypothetical protein Q8K64_03725 [Sediminibacterium sp.]|nr:hypothetical protein [Sediminibacterium sp.]
MKKILLGLLLFIGMFTVNAQTKPAEKEKAKVVGVKKADGTLDMRYKENKEKAKADGPKKADGTPDMRYKENKQVNKASSTKPVKKN